MRFTTNREKIHEFRRKIKQFPPSYFFRLIAVLSKFKFLHNYFKVSIVSINTLLTQNYKTNNLW